MSSPVFICSSSFGAEYVRTHGHAKAAELAARAGAYGIEIRQELMTSQDQPLTELADNIKHHDLDIYYSSTELLWLGEHLNDNIQTSIETARALGASLLKIAIGSLPQQQEVIEKTLSRLSTWLEGSTLVIALENDQTSSGGSPDALLKACKVLNQAKINTGLVFDTGNWRWVGINATDAANEVGQQVCYIHCKGIQQQGQSLHAAPPSPVELVQWSDFWSSFRSGTPRGIEFPLASSDDPAAEDSALVETAKNWVTRLGHL